MVCRRVDISGANWLIWMPSDCLWEAPGSHWRVRTFGCPNDCFWEAPGSHWRENILMMIFVSLGGSMVTLETETVLMAISSSLFSPRVVHFYVELANLMAVFEWCLQINSSWKVMSLIGYKSNAPYRIQTVMSLIGYTFIIIVVFQHWFFFYWMLFFDMDAWDHHNTFLYPFSILTHNWVYVIYFICILNCSIDILHFSWVETQNFLNLHPFYVFRLKCC